MLIGLTGGIGSGKSTVSGYLEKQGITVVDADRISRLVVMPGSEALDEIKDVFGEEYILPDGNLDRKKLGRYVFSDRTALWKLNYIMSNRIGQEIDRQIKASTTDITVLDAATLIESGYDTLVDALWIVDADDEVRIKRVMERDGATRQEVLDRMGNQMTREERLARECTVIDNSGSVEETYANVKRALDEAEKNLKK